jgi:hypothetical protein
MTDTDTDGRETLTLRLRLMADWLDANPQLPISPYSDVQIIEFCDMEQAREARRSAPGGWKKSTSPTDNFITYEHHAEESDSIRWRVIYAIHVSKKATCERVQVGTKHVEEHDEPVFEWKCDE